MSRLLTFRYNNDYIPPIPVIEVEIDGYGDASPVRILALVDSGADSSMIPLERLQAVDASYRDSRQMRGIAGGVQIVDRYLVGITIGKQVVPGVQVVAHENEAIIGRDVLNELLVTLNGPANMTEIQVD